MNQEGQRARRGDTKSPGLRRVRLQARDKQTTVHLVMAVALCRIGVLPFVVLFLLLRVRGARAEEPNEEICSESVRSWSGAQLNASSSLPPGSAFDRLKLRNLLFFLHIPRTGGRTFHQCFLKHLFASDERCPRSYDKLRIDRGQPGCRLISTHDDYSVLEKLSHQMTSVVTSVRHPVDRVLSSYEFSIEVAARSLKKFRKKPLSMRSPRPGSRISKFMSTLDIWPWKFLVPIMEKDLVVRRDARLGYSSTSRLTGDKNVSLFSVNNSYDAAALAMPFHEFIHHPVALELVHNGATFQVAGLTNTSYSEDAGVIRTCVVRFPHLGKHVVNVAKERLDRMLYVGLTDRQNESVAFLAKVVGEQVSMDLMVRSMLQHKRLRSPRSPRRVPDNFTSLDGFKDEDVTEEVLTCYRECVADLRKVQEDRRSLSLDTVSPIKFSRETRGVIPEYVIEEVTSLNELDGELHAHAQILFARQQEFLQQGGFHFSHARQPEKLRGKRYTQNLNHENEFHYFWEFLQDICSFAFLILATSLLVLVAVLVVVNKRQGARVKET